ncbi:hypothetical protein T12_15230 [Trichinella patagoniensis]|uniref:Uncharacterized protein n=1 Tax=Trichinella patagoniensis TaxID=990121 RepID=A0A0V0Z063_9BILA|nr:hypothetical protein T12_15230 [Trichinella patagoniensis]
MANDERRWKLFVANRVKEIQDLSQLLETLSYERQSTRLVQQGATRCTHFLRTSCGGQDPGCWMKKKMRRQSWTSMAFWAKQGLKESDEHHCYR